MSTQNDNDDIFDKLLSKKGVPEPSTPTFEEVGSAIIPKPDTLANAPSLRLDTLLADAPKVSLVGKLMLGATYSEAERAQLKAILKTRNSLLSDKLAILEKQSELFLDHTIAVMTDSANLQSESELTNLRTDLQKLRAKQLKELEVWYVGEIVEAQHDTEMPQAIIKQRILDLTEDYQKARSDIRSGAILARYGLTKGS